MLDELVRLIEMAPRARLAQLNAKGTDLRLL